MNTKKSKPKRAVSIITRYFRDWRYALPGAVLAGAMGSASPALAMGDGLSPGLFPLPPSVGDRALLACDTDENGDLNGCNAAGVQYLAFPSEHAEDLFWNNGETIEAGTSVQGMQEVGIVGKESAAASFDEVCVTVDVRGGPPRDRGKLVCVEIVPAAACTDCTTSSCNAAVPVVSDPGFCTDVVLPELQTGYVINGLGYVIDVNLSLAGESGSTTIHKCAGFAHRCTPVRDDVVVKGSRQTAAVETPHIVGGYLSCRTC
jgi:hypothetical protein